MHALERNQSMGTQAFEAVEQVGICCSTCTPIPMISATGAFVVTASRIAHAVYDYFRHPEGCDQPERPRDERPEFVRSNSIIEFKSTIPDAGSDNNSEVSTHRHVRIVLHQNSDDEIDQIEVEEFRNSG